jgi:hypothetical protein
MDRRKWIIHSIECLAAMACDRVRASPVSVLSDIPVHDAKDAFDHILLGVSDLEVGIRKIEEQTGVRAKLGGAHPGRGTRNALLSLGRLHYLEIIAPDPAQVDHPDELGLAQLSSPRIVQWAIHTEDIAAVKHLAEEGGIKTIGPQPGSRQRPDGKRLQWQTLGIEEMTPLVPFFIQWEAGSPHPSSDAPQLGAAKSLHFETPQPEELRRILHGVAIKADIRKSDSPCIKLIVQTASGAITMS